MYLVVVNREKDGDKIWGLKLEFEVRKGKPIEIKLEEWKLHCDPEEWNQAVSVCFFRMYGPTSKEQGLPQLVAR